MAEFYLINNSSMLLLKELLMSTMNIKSMRKNKKGLLLCIISACLLQGHIAISQKTSKTPIMGWMSWNLCRENVNEKIIKDIADALVATGLKKAGYTLISIDDGWVGGRDMQNNLIANPEKFPNGMKALAEYVHSKGLKLGIYSSASQTTCLDLTGSYGFEQQDANRFADWGIDYLKYDWCGNVPENNPEELRIRNEAMSKAIANTKAPFAFAFWGGFSPEYWVRSLGNNWRIAYDIRDVWKSYHPQRKGILQAYEACIQLDKLAGPYGFNDPDMLVVGLYGTGKAGSAEGHTGGCTDIEYQTQMSLWCLMASPLFLSADIAKLNQTSLNILKNKEMISINQDTLCRQARRIIETNMYDVLIKPLADGDYALGLLNKSDDIIDVSLPFNSIGLIGDFMVKDVWRQRNSTSHLKSWKGEVMAHETVVLRLSKPVNRKKQSTVR